MLVERLLVEKEESLKLIAQLRAQLVQIQNEVGKLKDEKLQLENSCREKFSLFYKKLRVQQQQITDFKNKDSSEGSGKIDAALE